MEKQEAPFYLRRTKEAMVTFPDPETGLSSPVFRDRDVQTTSFELLPGEFDFYKELTDYIYQQSSAAARDSSAKGRALGFAMAMYQRRFASSLHAALMSLERRKKKLADQLAKPTSVAGVSIDPEDLEELDEAEAEKRIEQIEEASLPIDRAAISAEISALEYGLQPAPLDPGLQPRSVLAWVMPQPVAAMTAAASRPAAADADRAQQTHRRRSWTGTRCLNGRPDPIGGARRRAK